LSNLRPKGVAIRAGSIFIWWRNNKLPEGYDPAEWESKGFHEAKTIQDFVIRTNLVYLVARR
jgi:hypothetical protein